MADNNSIVHCGEEYIELVLMVMTLVVAWKWAEVVNLDVLYHEFPKILLCEWIWEKGSYSLSDCMYLATHNFHYD